MNAIVGVMTVSGVDQTSPVTNGRFVAFNSSPTAATSLTIPSNPGDRTASIGFTTNQWQLPGPTNQAIAWGSGAAPIAGDVGSGTGTTTHTWTDQYVGITHSVSGANFRAAGP